MDTHPERSAPSSRLVALPHGMPERSAPRARRHGLARPHAAQSSLRSPFGQVTAPHGLATLTVEGYETSRRARSWTGRGSEDEGGRPSPYPPSHSRHQRSTSSGCSICAT
jgi:hypothetical protein